MGLSIGTEGQLLLLLSHTPSIGIVFDITSHLLHTLPRFFFCFGNRLVHMPSSSHSLMRDLSPATCLFLLCFVYSHNPYCFSSPYIWSFAST